MNLINNNIDDTLREINISNNGRVKTVNSFYSILIDITQQVNFKQQKTLIASDIDQTILIDADFEQADEIFGDNLIYKSVLEKNVAYNINYISKYADVILITSRNIDTPANMERYGINLCNEYNEITLNENQKKLLTTNGYDFNKNVIYTSGAEKGTALKIIYDFSKTKYSNVFFIDDFIENCEQVNKVLTDAGIKAQTYNIIIDDIKKNYCNLPQDTQPLIIETATLKQKAYFHAEYLTSYSKKILGKYESFKSR